jgi:hypothetical protein
MISHAFGIVVTVTSWDWNSEICVLLSNNKKPNIFKEMDRVSITLCSAIDGMDGSGATAKEGVRWQLRDHTHILSFNERNHLPNDDVPLIDLASNGEKSQIYTILRMVVCHFPNAKDMARLYL